MRPKHLARIAVLSALSLASVSYANGGEEPSNSLVFHFDFKDSNGKNEITDTTGKHKCLSMGHNFETQDGFLRIAPDDARIHIPSEKMPKLTDELTITLWVARKTDKDFDPLLFKGAHQEPIQFLLSLNTQFPEFCYKNQPSQGFWKGIHMIGSSYGNSLRYNNPQWLVKGANPEVKAKQWTHLGAVFNKGDINIYVNGFLVLCQKSDSAEQLKLNDFPICIGSERVAGEKENFRTADILLNDLRLFKNALPAEEIRKAYESEKDKYAGARMAFEKCDSYLSPSAEEAKTFDYSFKNKLQITREYEKDIKARIFPAQTTSAVKVDKGVARMFVGQEEKYPLLILSPLYPPSAESVDLSSKLTRDFAAAGVNLVTLNIGHLTFWKDDKKYDWEQLDMAFKAIIDANPNADIIFNLYLKPPKWFVEKYPDEFEKYYHSENGDELRTWTESAPLASEKWLSLSLEMLGDTIKHIEKSNYSNRVCGYHIGGGDAAEWYWPGSFVYGGMTGYSKRTKDCFQKWLRKKYAGDVSLLKKAWNKPELTFESAEIPSPKERNTAEFFIFRVREKAGNVFDFREFLNDTTMKNITESCKVAKENSGFKKVVCTYYGYVLLYAGGNGKTLYKGGLQNLSKVFASPYIDFVATPLDYNKRRGGEPGMNINPFYASARLHDKLIWNEADLRTHYCTSKGFGKTSGLRETLTVMERCFGYSLTQNCGLWFFPFVHAWFHQEDMMRTVASLQKLADASLKDRRESASQIAFIFDEKSADFTAIPQNINNIVEGLCWNTFQEAAKMGAPFDMYLLSDIKNPKMPDNKLYVFMNSFYVDKETREAISAKVKRGHAVAVWCYASGYVTDYGFDANSMKELIGMDMEEEKSLKTLTLEITDKNNPITKYAKTSKPHTFGPVFHVTDNNVKVIGTAGGKPALAIKEFGEWKSVYTLLPLDKDLLTGLCEYAGVHVYSKTSDVFFASKSHIMLHTSSAGEKTITLPEKFNVTEILTNTEIGKGISQFTEKLTDQATRIYKITK